MEYKFSNKVTGLQASAIREILKFTSDPDKAVAEAGAYALNMAVRTNLDGEVKSPGSPSIPEPPLDRKSVV